MAKIKGLHARLIKEQMENAFKKKGYAFFDGNRALNLNLISVRNKSHDSTKFDDTIFAIYRNEDKE